MKAYEAFLNKKKIKVHYINATENQSDIRKLIPALAKEGVTKIHFTDPTDNWLEKRLRITAAKYNIDLVEYENPLFINSREELLSFFKPEKKSFFQTTFYKQQRKKSNILLTGDDEPIGGKWSFDADNRKKYPKGKVPPAINFPKKDKYWKEAVAYVEQHFADCPGMIDFNPLYPYTAAAAKKWLQQFV